MTPEHFAALKADFLAALTRARRLCTSQDLFGGSQPEHRVNVRVVNELAWHNLFIRTLLVRPEARRARRLRRPNTRSSTCRASAPIPARHGSRSETVIAVNLTEKLILIGGTAMPAR